MKKVLFVFFLVIGLLPWQEVLTQNINLLGFVRPRIGVFANTAPRYQLNDSVSFSETQAGINLTLPFRSRFEMNGGIQDGRGLARIKGSFWLANVNARYRTARTEAATDLKPFLSLSAGVTGVKFSMKKGFWIYSAGGGFVEEVGGFGAGSTFLYGAFTKLRIRGLRRLNAYGLAVVASRRLILPIPIVGWYRSYKRKRTLTVVLPLFIRFTQKIKRNTTFRAELNLNGFNAGFAASPNPLYAQAPMGERLRLGHSHLRMTAGIGQKLGQQWWLGLDVGANFPTFLRIGDQGETLYRTNGLGGFYGGVTLRYRLKMNGMGNFLESTGLF